MITKVTMIKDGDCVNCAVMEKVMEEYCAADTDVNGVHKSKWDFKVLEKSSLQADFIPNSFPTWRLYCDQTHSVFEMPVTDPRNFIDAHNKYIRETYL